MLTPTQFDEKMGELREINSRMQHYTANTPMQKVAKDLERAEKLYAEISTTLDELKEEF